MNLPKVLIIGQPFNNDTGGGITLSNLFKNWTREKLAVSCSGYLLLDNIDTEVCNNYYRLGYNETKWRFPFNYVQRKYKSGPIEFDEKKIQNLTIKKSKARVQLIMKVLIPFIEHIGLSHIITKTILSQEFQDWAKDFNPDILYVQPTSRDGILFCLALHTFLKKPLVFHIMDDWPAIISSKGFLKKFWSKKIDRDFRKLLDEADVLMSISEEMSRVYKIRYQKDFIPFHNAINTQFWGRYQKNYYALPGTPKILYAGRIGLGIETSLEVFAKAIQNLNAELNLSIRFVLQTPVEVSWSKNYSCVEQGRFTQYNDLPKVFSEADFLLLPYDFSPKSIKYIQYSMPTKAPEYMASGTPIILLAPGITAIVKFCEKYKCAMIITEPDYKTISDKLKEIINSESERKKIAENAKKIAVQNHDLNKVTNDFEKLLTSLSAGHENV